MKITKAKVVLIVVTAIILIAVFAVAEKFIKEASNNKNIYLFNTETGSVVPTEVKVGKDVSENDTVYFLFDALKQGSTVKNLQPTVKNDVDIISYDIDEYGTMSLNLSKEALDIENKENLIFKTSVVYTMLDLEGVRKVKLYIDGERLKDEYGREVSYSANNVIVTSIISPEKYAENEFTLYFPTVEDRNKLGTEVRTVSVSQDLAYERSIMDQLLLGSEQDGLVSTIPPKTQIREVLTEDSICQIDLNSDFITGLELLSEEQQVATIYSIVNSVTESENANYVQILIESKKSNSFKSVDLSQPLSPNEDLVIEK